MNRPADTFAAHSRQEPSRSGFTLFEMLMVLAVVALVASLSWPNLVGQLQEHTVRSNAEEVRRVIDTARSRAVEEGTTYQFRYEPYGQKYLLTPMDLVNSAQQTQQTGNQFSTQRRSFGQIYEMAAATLFAPPELPTGQQLPTERLSTEFLALLANGENARNVSWSMPVLFHPDGSATDALFSVEDLKGRSIPLSIRGLTGTVSVGELTMQTGGSRGR